MLQTGNPAADDLTASSKSPCYQIRPVLANLFTQIKGVFPDAVFRPVRFSVHVRADDLLTPDSVSSSFT